MRAINFNNGWTCKHLENHIPGGSIDAMPSEGLSDGGINTGWPEGHDCLYKKRFIPGPALLRKTVVLEFEGVCHNAEFSLNSERLAFQTYGCANFYVDLTDKLNLGKENTFEIIVRNADRPNSPWHSGAGSYRPVTLWVAPKEHIQMNGLRVRTVSIDPATVEITVLTEGTGPVSVQISDGEQVIVTGITKSDGKANITLAIPDGKLWSTETPNLYTCKVTFGEDSAETTFGLRRLDEGAAGSAQPDDSPQNI